MIWLLGTISILIKHDLVFVVWTLFVYCYGWRRALVAMLLSADVFLATFIPYLSAWQSIARNVFLYQSIPGIYGISMLLPFSIVPFVLIMPQIPLAARKLHLSLYEALGLTVIAQTVLIPGFGWQYWILVPLFLVFSDRRVWLYVFESTVMTVLLLPVDFRLVNLVWLLCVTWLASYFVQLKRSTISGLS